VFKVDIDISLSIKDCPKSGLAAVDFRTANGLPPAPTNEERVTYRADTDEALCRALSWALNDDADLIVQTGSVNYRFDFACGCSGTLDSRPGVSGGSSTANFQVPAVLLRPFSDGTANAPSVVALITELGVQTAHFKGEVAAKEKERESEAVERKRLRDEQDAQAKRNKELLAERMAKWVSEFGSDRLKACVANGWECDAAYCDERLALEYPRWQFDGSHLPGWMEPRNPPVKAVAMFEQAKATVGDDALDTAELVYWTSTDDDGETVSGYAVTCKPDWTVSHLVYGYDGPVDDDE